MSQVHNYYEYDYKTKTIKLKNKRCPRCGSIMGHYKEPTERWYCGSCGYTEFLEKKS